MAYKTNQIMRMGVPDPVDPITGMPVQTTMTPPQAKPIGGGFNAQTQQNIQGMVGTPEMRQYGAAGMGAPVFMTTSPLPSSTFNYKMMQIEKQNPGMSKQEVYNKTKESFNQE